MTFSMQDYFKESLLKRIIAWEKKGYEVVHPITEKRTICKNYSYHDNRINKYKPTGLSQSTMYYVKMRKVV